MIYKQQFSRLKNSEKFREFFARDYNFSHDNNNNNLFQKKKDDKLYVEGNDNVVADSLLGYFTYKKIRLDRAEEIRSNPKQNPNKEKRDEREKGQMCVSRCSKPSV